MKMKYFLALIPLLVLISAPTFTSNAKVQQHATVMEHCDNATEFRSISTSSTEAELTFNMTDIKVPKNTCVQIKFFNMQTIEHDFTINHDDENGFEKVHIHMANNTAGNMNSLKIFYI
jgi:hypothetical protein